MKIVIDDKIPYIKGVLEPYAHVEYLPGSSISKNDVYDADAIVIRTRTTCNAELLSGSSVKFIATATIGFDHIDTNYCDQNNISWTNCPGCNSGSVKQYIVSALLSLAIKYQFSLKNKTIGIIGVGNVGEKIADASRAFGMNVLLNDPPRERVESNSIFTPLDDLIQQSDFITTHTPLITFGIDKTFHLVNKSFFEKMRNDAFYINTSRGEVACNNDLKDALKKRTIAGAVLDVWENEPNIDLELLQLLDFSTPHIAGYSKDGKANGTSMSIRALADFFDLPLKDWYPKNVPTPPYTKVEITPQNNTELEVQQIVSKSYDIYEDHLRFISNPSGFEEQRGNYPLRREFELYSFKSNPLLGLKTESILLSLGFNMI